MAETNIALENKQTSSETMRRFLSAIVRQTSGVLPSFDEQLEVVESATPAMSVVIEAGAALVGNSDELGFYSNSSDLTKSISANSSGSTRIDRIVVELDLSQSAGSDTLAVKVVEGTPGAGAPSLTQTATVYQMSLAQVTVADAETEITDSEITDERTFITALQPDESVVSLSSNESRTSTTTLADVSEFAFSAEVDATYHVRFVLCGVVGATPALKFLLAASAGSMIYDGIVTNHYGSGSDVTICSEAAARTVLGEDGVTKAFVIDILLRQSGSAATITFQFAQNSSSGTTITLYAEQSMMISRKVYP